MESGPRALDGRPTQRAARTASAAADRTQKQSRRDERQNGDKFPPW